MAFRFNQQGDRYVPVAKSQLKKVLKMFTRDAYKAGERSEREAEDAEKRAKNLEEARQVHILQFVVCRRVFDVVRCRCSEEER